MGGVDTRQLLPNVTADKLDAATARLCGEKQPLETALP